MSDSDFLALIADADGNHNAALATCIRAHGWEVETAHSLAAARRVMSERQPKLLVVALRCGSEDGLSLLELDEAEDIDEILIMGEKDDPLKVQRGIREGALYFFCKPFDPHFVNDLLKDLTAELGQPRARPEDSDPEPLDQFGLLRGSSRPMKRLYRAMRKVAPTEASVLLIGESGTGKELAAQTIHSLSDRSDQPLLPMNCGAIAKDLFESELFGHEKGAFTGATKRHQGFFERAHRGTLFLDEITEMPVELQVKLLRVLEVGRFRRVGGEQDLSSDVRIIAATNREPRVAIEAGLLREDLYYRIASFPLRLPPLRKRGNDIIGLAQFFLADHNDTNHRNVVFSTAALEQLQTYPWPGNVRELASAVERAYVLANSVIDADSLPNSTLSLDDHAPLNTPSENNLVEISVGDSIANAERELILATLAAHDDDKPAAAETLGISLKTLYNRLNSYEAEAAPADEEIKKTKES